MSDCIGNLENVSLGSVVERHLARLKKIDAVGEPHAVGVDGIVVRAVEFGGAWTADEAKDVVDGYCSTQVELLSRAWIRMVRAI